MGGHGLLGDLGPIEMPAHWLIVSRAAGDRPIGRIAGALALIAALMLLACLPAAASAAPAVLWQVPATGPADGSGAGQLLRPRGAAVDPDSGDVFVIDQANFRISQFTPWGEFVKSFGWKVNASAPADEPQVCTAATGCQAGTEGGGRGQIGFGSGIAIGEDGNVFVSEVGQNRIQVFAPDGSFLFMLGAEVNKTKVEATAPEAEQNRCPVDPGDVCQSGVTGTGPGEFSNKNEAGHFLGDYIATGPGGSIYVGDAGRIQKFNPTGEFMEEITSAALAGKAVTGLDVDSAGNSYVAFREDTGSAIGYQVRKLGPGGEVLPPSYKIPEPEGEFRPTQVEGLALGASGNLYVSIDPSVGWGEATLEARIMEFDAAGNVLIPSEAEEGAEQELGEKPIPPEPFLFGQVFGLESNFFITGLATSSACGIDGEDVFATYANPGFLRAYGPNPDPAICPPPALSPTITDTFASSVDTDGATVQAQINPRFWGDTTYRVQYGTGKCSDGGCTTEQPNAPGSALGSDAGVPVRTAGVFLTGLAPGTTYHYRFVAQSGGGGPTVGPEATFTTAPPPPAFKTDCPNQAFRTGRSAALPDCRAYEMVSPVDKEGGEVLDLIAPLGDLRASIQQSSLSGDRFTYSAYRPYGEDVKGAPYVSQYLASRGTGGWSNANISPPRGRPLQFVVNSNDSEYKAFSADLCQGWLRLDLETDPPLDPAEVEGYANLYRHDLCGGGGYEALTTVFPPHEPSVTNYTPEVQGHSADGRCTAFRAPDSLVPGAPFPGGSVLYESCAGTLRLVAVLPDGTPAPGTSTAGIGGLGGENTGFSHRTSNVASAVSADGRRIYWTTPGTGPGKLYLRINADKPQSAMSGGNCAEAAMACTLPVSEKVSASAARFWAASSDGTRAIFTIDEDLYEFDASNQFKTKATLIAKGVPGVMGASEDVSRLYFASTEALDGGASAGQPNLYFWQRGGAPRFIGTLSSLDLAASLTAISAQPVSRLSRVTPDGLHAVFLSAAPLTGYDNTDLGNAGEPLLEVFLYDASAAGGEGSLACLSCEPGGARPAGRDIDPFLTVWAAARIPAWGTSLYGSRVISEDGSRVFFDSFGPLVQRDTNGKGDVYEWQSASSETACEEAGAERYVEASAGCLSLISSGDGDQDSQFFDASSDGRDVFFLTGSSLLSQDPGLIDVYDARAGGGFPPPPTPPVACEGAACQKAAPPPNDPTPASASFRGQGDARPARATRRCPSGRKRVKKRGKVRCVKRNRTKRQKYKRPHRKTGSERRSHR